ncbi:hypothetical protein [Ralstonia pseudosolanacearum]|nr:hypothetical protein [Ralstonia pseudosolanacearum]
MTNTELELYRRVANGVATGINDHHIHPAEPRTLRAGIAWSF